LTLFHWAERDVVCRTDPCDRKEARISAGTHWRLLAITIEPFMWDGQGTLSKTAELIEMPFIGLICAGSRNND